MAEKSNTMVEDTGTVRKALAHVVPRAILAVVLMASAAFAHATDVETAVARLRAMRERPNVASFLDAFGGVLPDENPFKPMGTDTRASNIAGRAAELIAQLEYAYPGAVWAPLGRDTGLVADILEAYYGARGETDRVVRLNASTASFKSGGQELHFLASNGLIPSIDRPAERKFVILDPTSWNPGDSNNPMSQIRKLLKAYYARFGGAHELWRVNAIGLGASGRGKAAGPVIKEGLNVNEFWSSLDMLGSEPGSILYARSDFAYLHLNSNDSREASWHESFLAFVSENDRLIAPPGRESSHERRDHVLYLMYKVIKAVRAPEFQTAVSAVARRYGYDIDALKRTRLAALDDDAEFTALLESRRWTQDEIQLWFNSLKSSGPDSISVPLKVRRLQLAIHGVTQGAASAVFARDLFLELLREARTSVTLASALAFRLSKWPPGSSRDELERHFSDPMVLRETAAWETLVLYSPRSSEWRQRLPVDLRIRLSKLVHARLRGIKKVRTIDGILQRQERALALAREPNDFLAVLKPHVWSPSTPYRVKLGEFALQYLDRFIASGADIKQLKQFEKQALWEVKHHEEFLRRSFVLVKTVDDLFALTTSPYWSARDAYKTMLANFIGQNAESIVALPGMTVVKLKALEKRSVRDVQARMTLWKSGMRLVTSPEDFIALTAPGVSSPTNFYKQEIGKFLDAQLEKLADKPGMTVAGLKKIERKRYHLVPQSVRLMTSGLKLVRTKDDLTALTAFVVRNPSPAYRTEMTKFIAAIPAELKLSLDAQEPDAASRRSESTSRWQIVERWRSWFRGEKAAKNSCAATLVSKAKVD